MSLKNPYKHHRHNPEKEEPAQYDLFKDYYRVDKRKPDSDWDWYTWNTERDYNVLTTGKQGKEVFKFFNKEVEHECNVPEPTAISFVLLGGIIALGLKRKWSR